jgi:hypothetical protein
MESLTRQLETEQKLTPQQAHDNVGSAPGLYEREREVTRRGSGVSRFFMTVLK